MKKAGEAIERSVRIIQRSEKSNSLRFKKQ
jgi:hypothetical protein